MRRLVGIFSGVAVLAIAVAQGGTGLLGEFGKALYGAQSIKATYTVQMIGDSPAEYQIELKKPNLARIETPSMLIVADGKNITSLDKGQNTYTRQPQTDKDLKSLFANDELNVWAGFFNSDAYKALQTKNIGTKTRKGVSYSAVEATYDAKGRKVVTYFLNPADRIARQAQIDLNDPNGKVTIVVQTKDLALNGVNGDAFAFNAPEGSREISLDELMAGKWYTDLEEAKAVAAKTGRRIFVDFYATWCGPCKKLEAEVFGLDRFKALSKKFVFLRIDVDLQKSVAQAYHIEAMPTQMVLKADGSVVSTKVGYANPQDFFAFIDNA